MPGYLGRDVLEDIRVDGHAKALHRKQDGHEAHLDVAVEVPGIVLLELCREYVDEAFGDSRLEPAIAGSVLTRRLDQVKVLFGKFARQVAPTRIEQIRGEATVEELRGENRVELVCGMAGREHLA